MWRRKPNRINQNYRLAFIALAVLAALILAGKVFQLINSLNKPVNREYKAKAYTWEGQHAISVVFRTPSVGVMTYDPQQKSAVFLKVPDNAYMALPKNFGSWKVGSIYDLGQEENPPVGAELLKLSMEKLLGLPIDNYVGITSLAEEDMGFENHIAGIKSNPLTLLALLRGSDTDLTPQEFLRLFWALKSVREDKLKILDLELSDITQSKLLSDSTRVLGVDNIKLDLFIREKAGGWAYIQEGESVAVYNATNHPGLAQEVSRIITNIGGTVIASSNTENLKEQSVVLANNPSQTAERLMQIFAPMCLTDTCQAADPKVSFSRADINIILGEDYFRRKYQR